MPTRNVVLTERQEELLETLVKSGEGLWGERLVSLLEQYPNFAVMGEEGECLWYEDNRVTLTDERDEYGVPRAKVTFSYHENEQRMRELIGHTPFEVFVGALLGVLSAVSLR